MLDAILLRRFHSILAERVDLHNLVFFVGANGSGKSNFADAFALLAEIVDAPLQTAFDRRGGVGTVLNHVPGPLRQPFSQIDTHSTLGLGVEFSDLKEQPGSEISGRYGFEISPINMYGFRVVREQCLIRHPDGTRQGFDRLGGKFHTNVDWLKAFAGRWESTMSPSLLLPLLANVAPFRSVGNMLKTMRVYSIEPSKMRELQDVDIGWRLLADGRNATSVLNELVRTSREDIPRIVELLAAITPAIRSVHAVKRGRQLQFRFRQGWDDDRLLLFDAFNMSDGTLRALGILLALFQKPRPSVVVIEEPELTITRVPLPFC